MVGNSSSGLDHLASTAKRFNVEVCAVSLQRHDGDWELLGDISDRVKENMKASALFKLLIRRGKPTVISDAWQSSLIQDDALVAAADGSPRFRFYMEMPLMDSNGDCIGALILADREPKPGEIPASSLVELSALARRLEVELAKYTEAAPRSKTLQPVMIPSSATQEKGLEHRDFKHPPVQARSFTTSSGASTTFESRTNSWNSWHSCES
eukprot:TRINITY_DN28201_c0_g1_i1.p1 TRINITY_DN28201_c0_g1~~TRINITY_DN28201_c0_g1_i1.p1  ORF type:complete len:210 (+),score=33.06 TRINITY_DN28201_c0_g1_i1:56-685(+)